MGILLFLAAPFYALLAPFTLVSGIFGAGFETVYDIVSMWVNFFN